MFAIFGRLNTSLQILLRVTLEVDGCSRTISSRCKGTLTAVTHERVELQPHYSHLAKTSFVRASLGNIEMDLIVGVAIRTHFYRSDVLWISRRQWALFFAQSTKLWINC
jgi:hypothetical protein